MIDAVKFWRDGHPTMALWQNFAVLTIEEFVSVNAHMTTCENCARGYRELTGSRYVPATPKIEMTA